MTKVGVFQGGGGQNGVKLGGSRYVVADDGGLFSDVRTVVIIIGLYVLSSDQNLYSSMAIVSYFVKILKRFDDRKT